MADPAVETRTEGSTTEPSIDALVARYMAAIEPDHVIPWGDDETFSPFFIMCASMDGAQALIEKGCQSLPSIAAEVELIRGEDHNARRIALLVLLAHISNNIDEEGLCPGGINDNDGWLDWARRFSPKS